MQSSHDSGASEPPSTRLPCQSGALSVTARRGRPYWAPDPTGPSARFGTVGAASRNSHRTSDPQRTQAAGHGCARQSADVVVAPPTQTGLAFSLVRRCFRPCTCRSIEAGLRSARRGPAACTMRRRRGRAGSAERRVAGHGSDVTRRCSRPRKHWGRHPWRSGTCPMVLPIRVAFGPVFEAKVRKY